MAKLNTVTANAAQHVLLYGEPKSGKTQLAGELAKHFNLIWFDLENGFTTLLKLPEEAQARVDLIKLPDTKQFPIAIETMLKVITTGKPVDICDKHGKVNCALCKKAEEPFTTVDINSLGTDTIVVIDSLTQLSNSTMNHLLRHITEDTYKPEWSDYRNQGALLEKILSSIQQAQYNIVCITHVVETQLDDKTTKLVPMCGTTSFSRNTAKYFDHVILTQLKNRKHLAGSSTGFSVQALTGSRSDIELENGDTLLDIFRGKVKSPKVEETTGAMSALQRAKLKAQGK